MKRGHYRGGGKRIGDIVISSVALSICAPVFAAIAIAIRLDSQGPAFFSQERVGQRGKRFPMRKFRTMLTFEQSFKLDGSPLSNTGRVTRVGKLLRRSSLDELPQLFNILVGQMSLVGPRPALPYQTEKYDDFQRRRLEVRPGLTGLAQVSGRNSLSWSEKIDLDVRYVHGYSLRMDLMIVLKTVAALFKAEGIEFVHHDSISAHAQDTIFDVGYRAR